MQIVVTLAGKRTQIYLPMSECGDGWKGVALVIEGFTIGLDGGIEGRWGQGGGD